ncbi:MAG: hypothetical protein Q8R81_09590 [Novosphingobium sp.]|uniref:hypothetical protein n=1 Tax=Novosphingobium sp. TaxID=1874826 RepID=UPI00273371BF|nr:hypothetical protein [Novosphingobium sp.]MDP3550637.1 hypothetical protein [Novosphingobium sp.]
MRARTQSQTTPRPSFPAPFSHDDEDITDLLRRDMARHAQELPFLLVCVPAAIVGGAWLLGLVALVLTP